MGRFSKEFVTSKRSHENVGDNWRGAARKISQETKNAHPDIPWKDITGMRNRLIHEYFRIDIEKVWDTVRKDIPVLITIIEPLVPPEEET